MDIYFYSRLHQHVLTSALRSRTKVSSVFILKKYFFLIYIVNKHYTFTSSVMLIIKTASEGEKIKKERLGRTHSKVLVKHRYSYTILYYTILYYTILYYTILYYTILYYTILYYTILYYTILYYTILYHTIPYYTILYIIYIAHHIYHIVSSHIIPYSRSYHIAYHTNFILYYIILRYVLNSHRFTSPQVVY